MRDGEDGQDGEDGKLDGKEKLAPGAKKFQVENVEKVENGGKNCVRFLLVRLLRPLGLSAPVKSRLTFPYRARNISRP
jgi:hypothetical protein